MKPLGPADPRRVGQYQLLGRLGAGGMGSVYLARSARGRTVAVKLVQPELARQPEFRERFQREVDAARRVGQRWTAPVLDCDTEADTPWVATGYVAGPSLHEVVGSSSGPLPPRSLLALANGLTQALDDIHAAGIVHRDLKPSNVLVTIDGPRVIDFGIARAVEATGAGLTRTGSAVGSPGFMSPEQCRGEEVTPASDVFCLGSVLVFAATGRTPFGDATSAMHVLMLRIVQNQRDLTGVPDELLELVTACLRPDPADRPTSQRLAELTAAGDVWDDEDGEPWLPGALLARLGKQAVGLLDSEDPLHAPPLPPTPPLGSGSDVPPPPGAPDPPAARPWGPAPPAPPAGRPAAAPAAGGYGFPAPPSTPAPLGTPAPPAAAPATPPPPGAPPSADAPAPPPLPRYGPPPAYGPPPTAPPTPPAPQSAESPEPGQAGQGGQGGQPGQGDPGQAENHGQHELPGDTPEDREARQAQESGNAADGIGGVPGGSSRAAAAAPEAAEAAGPSRPRRPAPGAPDPRTATAVAALPAAAAAAAAAAPTGPDASGATPPADTADDDGRPRTAPASRADDADEAAAPGGAAPAAGAGGSAEPAASESAATAGGGPGPADTPTPHAAVATPPPAGAFGPVPATQPASVAPGQGAGGAGSGARFGADTPPPGTPPPGFGAPGGAAPEPRRGARTALPWLVGGALTALAVLGGFIAVNLGGKDADDGRSSAGSGTGSTERGGDEGGSGRGPAVGGGDVPREYLGAWEGEVLLDGDSIGARQRVEVRPGREGETITAMWWVLPEVMCVSDGELASTDDGLTLDVTLRDEVSQFGSGCVADQEQHLRAEDGKLFWSYEPDGLTAELEPAPVESGEHAVPPEQVGVWEPDEDYGEGIGVRVEIVRAKVGEPAVTWEMTVGDVACTWVHDVVAGDPDDDLMVTGPSRITDESDADACSDVYLNSLSIETEDDDQIEITPLVGSYGSEDPAEFVRVG